RDATDRFCQGQCLQFLLRCVDKPRCSSRAVGTIEITSDRIHGEAMTRVTFLASAASVILAGAAPTAADFHAGAPSSVRMRTSAPSRWLPTWFKRVAQATPDQPAKPDQPSAGDQTPSSDATPPPAAPPVAPAPGESPSPSGAQSPNLSDEELAKLSEAAAKTEVIRVTGSTIERKTLTTP